MKKRGSVALDGVGLMALAGRLPLTTIGLVAVLALALGLGCGDMAMDKSSAGEGMSPGAGVGDDRNSENPYEPEPGEDTDWGEEQQRELDFRTPQASENYIYVANTSRDGVVRIDARSLALNAIAVGTAPTVVATVPGEDTAVVINSGSDEVSIIRSDQDGDRVVHLPIIPHYNTLATSPAGGHILAYYRDQARRAGEGVGGLQDLSVIILDEGEDRVINYSVGYKPSSVAFNADGLIAYVVTDDGISVINLKNLEGAAIAPTLPVSPDPMASAQGRQVVITPDGAYAFIRSADATELVMVNLQEDGEMSLLQLDAVPTDLAITADGNMAVVVLRSLAQVVIIDIPQGIDDPEEGLRQVDLEGMLVGAAALTPDGRTAILFTTIEDTGYVVLLDLVDLTHRIVRIQRKVEAVAVSPDNKKALLFHPQVPAMAAEGRAHAYSLMELDQGFVRINNPVAAPGPFVFSPRGEQLYLALDDPQGDHREIQVVDLASFVALPMRLGSPPEHLGGLPAVGKVFVSQRHSTGRITFIDVDTQEAQTVTGYELNERIQ